MLYKYLECKINYKFQRILTIFGQKTELRFFFYQNFNFELKPKNLIHLMNIKNGQSSKPSNIKKHSNIR